LVHRKSNKDSLFFKLLFLNKKEIGLDNMLFRIALLHQDYEIIDLMLADARMDFYDCDYREDKRTLFFDMLEINDDYIMEAFLKSPKLKIDNYIVANPDETALMYAVKARNADLVKKLLKVGADIEKTDNMGWTALDFAAAQKKEGSPLIFKILQKYQEAHGQKRNNALPFAENPLIFSSALKINREITDPSILSDKPVDNFVGNFRFCHYG
jgi:ankyrin repeat protein